jgi:hypothetical protein
MSAWVEAWKHIIPDTSLETLQKDCAIVFNSRAIDTDENYSSGSTYFIKANETPNSTLEALAKAIFEQHTRGKTFDVEKSGAEWWSQVIHSDDDIGVHWDRDYGLEEEEGVHVHPNFGTVTYLSNRGAPTIVLNKIGSKTADEDILGNIKEMVISHCHAGNHLRFNGDLLHAAPSEVIQALLDDEDENDEEDDDEDDENVEKLIENISKKRITFLVNIWLNHIPSQSQRYQHNPALPALSNHASMAFAHFDNKINYIGQSNHRLDMTEKLVQRHITLQFNNHDVIYDVKIPLPSIDVVKQELQSKNILLLDYPEAENEIQLIFSETQLSEVDEDEDEDDDDDEEEGEEGEEGSDQDEDEEGDDDDDDEEEDDVAEAEHTRKKSRR